MIVHQLTTRDRPFTTLFGEKKVIVTPQVSLYGDNSPRLSRCSQLNDSRLYCVILS